MSKTKLQIGIYKIQDGIVLEEVSVAVEKKGYSFQTIEAREYDGYQLKLYYHNKSLFPKWKDFLRVVVESGQDILKDRKSWGESFVLFLMNASKGSLYAVVGGQGYFAIQDYVCDDFGIDVFARLIKFIRAIASWEYRR